MILVTLNSNIYYNRTHNNKKRVILSESKLTTLRGYSRFLGSYWKSLTYL